MSKEILLIKAQLRAEIERRRAAISMFEARDADEKIAERLFVLPEFQRSRTVFCYVSTEAEISTDRILEYALAEGKRICVPKCISKGVMGAYEIQALTDLSIGKFGIREPKECCSYIPPDEIDFAVVPCVTCDIAGNRLGRGGGYYDRYLQGRTYAAAALCREKLLAGNVPAEEHDMPIDIIITEKREYHRAN